MDDRLPLESTLAFLRDAEEPIGRYLAFGMSGMPMEEAEQIVAMLHELADERRHELYRLLLETSEEEYLIDLTNLFEASLEHADPVVRVHGIKGLWPDPRKHRAQKLLSMLNEAPETEVRAAAATGLGRYVYAVEFGEIDEKLGEAVRQALEGVIRSNDDLEVRRRAVEAIAYINDDLVRNIIDLAYDDENIKMQVSAVFAMGRSADRRWAPQVLRELRSTEPELQFEAVRAAGEMQLRAVVPIIAELIGSRDHDIRDQSIWALGQIGGDEAHDLLVELSEDDNSAVAELAESALEECDFADMMFDMMLVDEDTDLHEMDMSEFDLDDDEDDEDDQADQGWDDDVISLT